MQLFGSNPFDFSIIWGDNRHYTQLKSFEELEAKHLKQFLEKEDEEFPREKKKIIDGIIGEFGHCSKYQDAYWRVRCGELVQDICRTLQDESLELNFFSSVKKIFSELNLEPRDEQVRKLIEYSDSLLRNSLPETSISIVPAKVLEELEYKASSPERE